MSLSTISPLERYDTFECIMSFLDLADISRSARVCKYWNEFTKDNSLWKIVSEKEGISLVEGTERNRKEDFKTLYPRFISGKTISRLFGKVIGQIPPISEQDFNALKEEDPFETGKLKGETFVFVMRPDKVARTVDTETPLTLDASNELIESTGNSKKIGEVLEIPFSLKNHKMLCSYPLSGKENMPVFDVNSFVVVFLQCNTCPDKVSVYFMRKQIANESRNMPYAAQKELVKIQGFEVTPLSIRTLFDSVEILTSGTCPDNRNPVTYARTSDIVHYGNSAFHSVIGGFVSRVGVDVDHYSGDDDDFGVVPGRPCGSSPAKALDSSIS